MTNWDTIKKRRTPLTWGMITMFVAFLWATGILQLIWVEGVNASLVSDKEAEIEAENQREFAEKLFIALGVRVDIFEASIESKFNTDMIARARREINKINEAIRYDKALTEDEKQFKRDRKKELNALIKCIKEDKDNCIE